MDGSLDLRPDGTLVYRVFTVTGRLLYVGVTDDLCARMAGHRQTARWWHKAARVEWQVFTTRAEALQEEARLIRRLDPPENVMGITRWRLRLAVDEAHHDPGCEVGARLAHRRLSLGDRL